MKKSERLGMRIDPADKEEWDKLAAQAGLSLSAFIVVCVNSQVALLKRLTKS